MNRIKFAAVACLLGFPALAQNFGYDQVFSVTPTVQNAAYSSGNAIGGWQTINLRNTANPGGIVDYVQVISKGGATTAVTIYGFTKSSANLASTCTDKSAFSLSTSDLAYMIPGFPIQLTPAAPTGTTVSMASSSIIVSAKNMDPSPTQALTFCAVVGGSVTPATTSDLVFNYAVSQD
jgi:hypothetical protein